MKYYHASTSRISPYFTFLLMFHNVVHFIVQRQFADGGVTAGAITGSTVSVRVRRASSVTYLSASELTQRSCHDCPTSLRSSCTLPRPGRVGPAATVRHGHWHESLARRDLVLVTTIITDDSDRLRWSADREPPATVRPSYCPTRSPAAAA